VRTDLGRGRVFSYELERGYYSQHWPDTPVPYRHLGRYLRCWLEADSVFLGRRVLDIGAGECSYTRVIAEEFGPRIMVACDLFRERMLQAARANEHGALRFVSADCLQLPFRQAVFDIVFGSLVLCQLPALERVVAEIRRLLVPGGLYVGIEPNPYNAVHVYRYMAGKCSPNLYLLRPHNLNAFRRAGFRVEVRFFYARLPGIRSRLLATCMGVLARLAS